MGPAWADKAYAADTAHTDVECSNAGYSIAATVDTAAAAIAAIATTIAFTTAMTESNTTPTTTTTTVTATTGSVIVALACVRVLMDTLALRARVRFVRMSAAETANA